MPGWMNSTEMSRQSFLRLTSAWVAGAWVPYYAAARGFGGEAATNRFALCSDTHIAEDPKETYRGFFPAANLQAVIQDICDYPFDMAFINGDAARLDGKQEDYLHLQKLLQPLAKHCPITIGLGNHDDRDVFRKVFSPVYADEVKGANKHVTIVDTAHGRWLVLDSLMYVNKAAGQLGKAQRLWMAEYLKKSTDKPLWILVHHTLGDNDGELMDSGPLLSLVKAAPHVKAIFYGHSHQYHVKQDGGLYLVNIPAIGYNFSDKEPVGWIECETMAGGMRLKLHAMAGDQSKNGETHTLKWN